jgi:Right handed beta helix region
MSQQSRHIHWPGALRPGRLVAAIAVLALLAPIAVTASSQFTADASSTVVNGTRFFTANYSVSVNPPAFTIRSGQISLDSAPADYPVAAVFDQYPTVYSDMVFTFTTSQSPSLGTQEAYALARWTGNSSYSVRLRYRSDGSLVMRVMRTVNGRTRAVSRQTVVRGVRWSPSTAVRVRVVVSGRWPTTIKAKAWPAGTGQPSRWNIVGRDAAGVLQARAAMGLAAQTSAGSTTLAAASTSVGPAVTYTYGNVRAKGRGKYTGDSTPTPTPTPTSVPNPTPTTAPTPTPAVTADPTSTPGSAASCPQSLANALSSTPSGGTLDVRGCSYAGQFTIGRSMTLLGGTIVGRLFIKASDVTVDGLDISGSTAGAQQGTIDVPQGAANRLTLRNVHVHDGDGTGIKIRGGSGDLLENVEIDHMLQLGYGFGQTTGLVMRGSKIHDNNYTDKYNPDWEAGGGKMVQSTGAQFINNESWGNHGPGFWDDIYDHGTVFRGNRAWQNTRAGIMVEVSFNDVVTGNVLWDNYYGQSRVWWQTASILNHSSTGTQITGNVVYHTDIGIGIDAQARPDWPNVHPYQDIRVEGNTIIDCSTLVAWADDEASQELFQPSNGNGGANNRYWKSQAEPTSNRFRWGGTGYGTLAAFNATPAEQNGSYLTTAQMNAILDANSIPH